MPTFGVIHSSAGKPTQPYVPDDPGGPVDNPAWLEGLVVLRGQSNIGVGQGTTQQADNIILPAYTGARLDVYGATTRATPVTTFNVQVAERDLQPYATGATPGISPAQSLGRFLTVFTPATEPLQISTFGVNGSPLQEQQTYPTAGAGSYSSLAIARVQAREIATSRSLSCLIAGNMESDATDPTWTANFQANLEAEYGPAGPWRTTFGDDWLLVLPHLGDRLLWGGLVTAGRINDCNAAMTAFAAMYPSNTVVVPQVLTNLACAGISSTETSAVYLSNDGIHNTANGYWVYGNVIGRAIAEKTYPTLVPYSRGSGPAPFLQWGDNNACSPLMCSDTVATGDITVIGPPSHSAGDIDVLLATTGLVDPVTAPALTTPAGFTLLGDRASASGGSTEHVSVWLRTADQPTIDANGGRMPDPVMTDVSQYKSATMITVRGSSGIDNAGALWASQANNAVNTTVALTSPGSSSGANRLVVYVIAGFSSAAGASIATVVNANLTGLAVVRDSYDPTNQCIAVATGVLPSAGAVGNLTGTRSTAGLHGVFGLVFAP